MQHLDVGQAFVEVKGAVGRRAGSGHSVLAQGAAGGHIAVAALLEPREAPLQARLAEHVAAGSRHGGPQHSPAQLAR